MDPAPIARSSRFIYCIPPHTHALMRFRVHSVTPAHVAYYEASGVTVDSETAADLGGDAGAGEGGPIRMVPQAQIDVQRTWEGAPPGEAVYYSSVESYRRLHEMALARYGLRWMPPVRETGEPRPDGPGWDGPDWDGPGWGGPGREAPGWEEPDRNGPVAREPEAPATVSAEKLDRLRREMMAAHPDHGGTAEAFEKAYEAYEAARRQRDADS